MPNINRLFAICFFAFLFLPLSWANNTASPVGYWKTIDDVSGQTKSVVQIFVKSDHRLAGRVVKLFVDPGKICTLCEGPNKNQPVTGMLVIDDVKLSSKNASLWTDGHILDPKNGKVYHCQLQLSKDGQQLLVRGYIGLPLLGRSQTWIRTSYHQ